jgi:hypothetical protein
MADHADGLATDRDNGGESSCGDAAVPHLDRASVSDRSEGTASIGRPSVTPHGAARLTTVTVVGRRCLGSDDPAAAAAALRLAEAAAAERLAVQFEGTGPTLRFCAASPWPDVAAPAVADALLAWLTAAGGRGGA